LHPGKKENFMATFNVCSTVTVGPGGSFTWNNPNAQQVKVQAAPGTTWPLPQSSYTINGNGGQQAITLPIGAGLGTYQISVTYTSIGGGTPCQGAGANPKIVVSPALEKAG
jgi:hypothetical protein